MPPDVSIPYNEFMAEHKRITKLLDVGKRLTKEAKGQRAELKAVKSKMKPDGLMKKMERRYKVLNAVKRGGASCSDLLAKIRNKAPDAPPGGYCNPEVISCQVETYRQSLVKNIQNKSLTVAEAEKKVNDYRNTLIAKYNCSTAPSASTQNICDTNSEAYKKQRVNFQTFWDNKVKAGQLTQEEANAKTEEQMKLFMSTQYCPAKPGGDEAFTGETCSPENQAKHLEALKKQAVERFKTIDDTKAIGTFTDLYSAQQWWINQQMDIWEQGVKCSAEQRKSQPGQYFDKNTDYSLITDTDERFRLMAKNDYEAMGGDENVARNFRNYEIQITTEGKNGVWYMPTKVQARCLYLMYIASQFGEEGLYQYYWNAKEGDNSAEVYMFRIKAKKQWGDDWDILMNRKPKDENEATQQHRILDTMARMGALGNDCLEAVDKKDTFIHYVLNNWKDIAMAGTLLLSMIEYLSCPGVGNAMIDSPDYTEMIEMMKMGAGWLSHKAVRKALDAYLPASKVASGAGRNGAICGVLFEMLNQFWPTQENLDGMKSFRGVAEKMGKVAIAGMKGYATNYAMTFCMANPIVCGVAGASVALTGAIAMAGGILGGLCYDLISGKTEATKALIEMGGQMGEVLYNALKYQIDSMKSMVDTALTGISWPFIKITDWIWEGRDEEAKRRRKEQYNPPIPPPINHATYFKSKEYAEGIPYEEWRKREVACRNKRAEEIMCAYAGMLNPGTGKCEEGYFGFGMNKKSSARSRMKGGADTALLTLASEGEAGQQQGERMADGTTPINQRNSLSEGLLKYSEARERVGATLHALELIQNPRKNVIKDVASDLVDIYGHSSLVARQGLDSAYGTQGFIGMLNSGVKLTGAKAQKYFREQVERLQSVENPLPAGSGKPIGCGCGTPGCNRGARGGAEAQLPNLAFIQQVKEATTSEAKKLNLKNSGVAPAPGKVSEKPPQPPQPPPSQGSGVSKAFLKKVRKALKKKVEGGSGGFNRLLKRMGGIVTPILDVASHVIPVAKPLAQGLRVVEKVVGKFPKPWEAQGLGGTKIKNGSDYVKNMTNYHHLVTEEHKLNKKILAESENPGTKAVLRELLEERKSLSKAIGKLKRDIDDWTHNRGEDNPGHTSDEDAYEGEILRRYGRGGARIRTDEEYKELLARGRKLVAEQHRLVDIMTEMRASPNPIDTAEYARLAEKNSRLIDILERIQSEINKYVYPEEIANPSPTREQLAEEDEALAELGR